MTERTLDLIGLGRTIFGAPAEAWFAGEMTDAAATAAMSASYARLMEMWRGRKAAARAPTRATEEFQWPRSD